MMFEACRNFSSSSVILLRLIFFYYLNFSEWWTFFFIMLPVIFLFAFVSDRALAMDPLSKQDVS